ncbi:hypothetical protein CALVIDRAFT_603021 [Calocera viscosa TUFC12733]|uniref:F-box domain-containing protein n=1 Tax=Calocera viscosa (strain TUFC12733) TaxID=1330018 RepID=A0A167GAP4_CALVF|nr:hypothetical protein CALVIDRAFT_603021 [Calocera viscosa TUFC12733]
MSSPYSDPFPLDEHDADDERPDFGHRWNEAALEDERLLHQQIEHERRKIEHERRQIEKARHHIELHQASLISKRDRLFTMRANRAPITRVSDDVLSLIFEFSADDLNPQINPCQVICSHVCHRWRTVAFRTSSLWTRFEIDSERSLSYAEQQLDEHKPFRFEVNIAPSCRDSFFDRLVWKICEFVTVQSHRLSHLQFTTCHHATKRFFSLTTYDLPALRSLAINPPFDITSFCPQGISTDQVSWNGEGIASAPVFHRFSLKDAALPSGFVALSNVTRLSLTTVDLYHGDDLVRMLCAFPRLQELHISHVRHRGVERLTVTERVCCTSLKKLYVDGEPRVMLDNLPAFVMPNLEHLILSDVSGWDSQLHLTKFFQHLDSVVRLNIFWDELGGEVVECLKGASNHAMLLLPDLHTLTVINRQHSSGLDWDSLSIRDEIFELLPQVVLERRSSRCPLERLQISPPLTKEERNLFEGHVILENIDPISV